MSSFSTSSSLIGFLTTIQPGHYTLAIHAKPGARTSDFSARVQPLDTALEVRVGAPPVEGQANTELVDFLQSTLDAYAREMQLALSGGGNNSSSVYGSGVYGRKHPSSSSHAGGSSSSSSSALALEPNPSLAVYFADTSYEDLMAGKRRAAETAAEAAAAASAQGESGGGGKSGKKKSKSKGGGGKRGTTTGGGDAAAAAAVEAGPLPARVAVVLSRGSTSRSKLVEVEFPGSEIELVCLLQLASRDAK